MIQNSLKILLIYILTTKQIAFSQSNQIQLEFKEPNNTIFTRTLDSVGNNHHELELLAIKDDKDSINSDCKIYIKIEHFNTTNKDITLIDTIIFIPKESFYRADTVFTKINLSSKNDTLKFPK